MMGAQNMIMPYLTTPISTYERAVRLYDTIKPVRGRPPWTARPLGNRRSKIFCIYRAGPDNDRIVVKLYSTAILTYFPDDCINVEPVGTRLTQIAINVLLGWRLLNPRWLGETMTTRVGGRWYYTPDMFTIRHGEMVSGSRPLAVPGLDQGAARSALHKSGYLRFVAWMKVCDRMGLNREPPRWPEEVQHGSDWMINRLLDGERSWSALSRGFFYDRENSLKYLRLQLYRHYGCISYDNVMSWPSEEAMEADLRRERTYG